MMSALEGLFACLRSVLGATVARVSLDVVALEGATAGLSFVASAAGVVSRETDIVMQFF